MDQEDQEGGRRRRHQGAPGRHAGASPEIRRLRPPPARENGQASRYGHRDEGEFNIQS